MTNLPIFEEVDSTRWSESYRKFLPEKLTKILELCAQIELGEWNENLFNQILMSVHEIVVTAHSYHQDNICIQASILEEYLKMLADGPARIESVHQIDQYVRLIEKALQDEIDRGLSLEAELPLDIHNKTKILIVDDDRFIREFLAQLLSDRGFVTYQADNGYRAIQKFKKLDPDFIFMDVMMPGLNGYEAASKIKEACQDKLVPIIFLTALDSDEDLTRCIDCGGDDFLVKPVNPAILDSRIKALMRLKELNERLTSHQRKLEEELKLSKCVFDSIVDQNEKNISNINTWMISPSDFSGDVVAYKFDSKQNLYLFAGDFTGHGLPAAIGAIPTADIFYQLVSQGEDINTIARAINNKLCRILPIERFCASCVLEICWKNNVLSIWNGGMPSVVLLNRNNGLIVELQSNKPPLGIVPDLQFQEKPDSYKLTDYTDVIIYSDGLNETSNRAGEMFGSERVLAALAQADKGSNLVELIKSDFQSFIGSVIPEDDVSVIHLSLEKPMDILRA